MIKQDIITITVAPIHYCICSSQSAFMNMSSQLILIAAFQCSRDYKFSKANNQNARAKKAMRWQLAQWFSNHAILCPRVPGKLFGSRDRGNGISSPYPTSTNAMTSFTSSLFNCFCMCYLILVTWKIIFHIRVCPQQGFYSLKVENPLYGWENWSRERFRHESKITQLWLTVRALSAWFQGPTWLLRLGSCL